MEKQALPLEKRIKPINYSEELLYPNKNKLIIVIYGVCGAGKSYVLNRFQNNISNAKFISIDSINNDNLQVPNDKIKNSTQLIQYFLGKNPKRELSNIEINQINQSIENYQQRTIQGYNHLLSLTKENLKYSDIVFVEGAFGGYNLEQFFASIIDKCEFQLIYVNKKREEVIQNFEKRKKEFGHLGGKGLSDRDIFYKVLDTYPVPEIGNLPLIDSTIILEKNSQVETVVKEIENRIKKWRTNK